MNDQRLQAVAYENMRIHQIGGETDGISAEVAEDLGFEVDGVPDPETTAKIDEILSAQDTNHRRGSIALREIVGVVTVPAEDLTTEPATYSGREKIVKLTTEDQVTGKSSILELKNRPRN